MHFWHEAPGVNGLQELVSECIAQSVWFFLSSSPTIRTVYTSGILGIMRTKGIHSHVFINAPNQPSTDTPLTPLLTLTWYLINISAVTPTIFADMPLSVIWYIWVGTHLIDYWPTVNGVSTECGLSIDQDVNKVSIKMLIECPSRVDWKYWWTLSHRLVPLIHTIHFLAMNWKSGVWETLLWKSI